MKRRFTEKELAEILGVSMSKLRQDRLLKRGLPYVKYGKTVRYREEDLDAHELKNMVTVEN